MNPMAEMCITAMAVTLSQLWRTQEGLAFYRGPLNLYDIHPDPRSCPWFEWDHENVPALRGSLLLSKELVQEMAYGIPRVLRE